MTMDHYTLRGFYENGKQCKLGGTLSVTGIQNIYGSLTHRARKCDLEGLLNYKVITTQLDFVALLPAAEQCDLVFELVNENAGDDHSGVYAGIWRPVPKRLSKPYLERHANDRYDDKWIADMMKLVPPMVKPQPAQITLKK